MEEHDITPLREALESELPRNARVLLARALDLGWLARATYCRGPKPTKLDPTRLVDCVAVRIQGPGVRLAALWIDGAFWRGLSPVASFTLAELRAIVEARPSDVERAA